MRAQLDVALDNQFEDMIDEGITEADAGQLVPHGEVVAWLRSWELRGAIYNDITFGPEKRDPQSVASHMAEIDWSQNAPMWSEIITTRTRKYGETQQVLGGAGASNRRYITKMVRDHLGLLNVEPEHAEAA